MCGAGPRQPRRVGTAKGIVYHKRSAARRMPKYGRKKQKGKCCYERTQNHGAAGHCGKHHAFGCSRALCAVWRNKAETFAQNFIKQWPRCAGSAPKGPLSIRTHGFSAEIYAKKRFSYRRMKIAFSLGLLQDPAVFMKRGSYSSISRQYTLPATSASSSRAAAGARITSLFLRKKAASSITLQPSVRPMAAPSPRGS